VQVTYRIQKSWEGTGTATGIVGLYPAGLPIHLKPTAKRLDFGSGLIGEQRVTARDYVFTHDTTDKTIQVLFAVPTADSTILTADNDTLKADATTTTAGSVTFEGTNNDPGSEPWVVLTTLTADGVGSSVIPYRFVRVKTTDLGSAGVFQVFVATSN
jgi:hypothetical protein